MAKYTPQELADKASEALKAREQKDIRYQLLVVAICAETGLTPDEVDDRIELLAMGAPVP